MSSQEIVRPIASFDRAHDRALDGAQREAGHIHAGGMRVDTVPALIRPVYLAVAWTLALILYSYYWLCRLTSRIVIEGSGDHDLSKHSIFCMWHESLWPYFVVFLRYHSPHAMISHPAAYMKPVHIVFRLMGLKRLLLGSSGEEGRRAVNEVAQLPTRLVNDHLSRWPIRSSPSLKERSSTSCTAERSANCASHNLGVSRFIPWPSWDSKKFPLPFSRIAVTAHQALIVTRENFDEIAALIKNVLRNGPGEDQVRSLIAA